VEPASHERGAVGRPRRFHSNAARVAAVLPAYLRETARSTDCPPGLRLWVADLPRTVIELAARWELQVGDPYQPGGRCSWVAPAVDARGRSVVLKVGWTHPEAAHEADALRFWAGDGAVRLHAAQSFADTSALLLERCRPGGSLGSLVGEPEQDVVIARLLGRLWRDPPALHPYRTLTSMCGQWADEAEQTLADGRPVPLDVGLVRAGLELLRVLPASAARQVLLCTDLHADNVLAAQREPWLVIDPKPHVGDPAFDVLQHLLNCTERLQEDPYRLAGRMAHLLDLDRQRLMSWLFARCVQESVDDPSLAGLAARLAPS